MTNKAKPATYTSRPFDIAPEARDARQQAIAARIEGGPRGRMPVNLRAWLHNPDFIDVAEPFGLYVSQLAPITKRQKEILVLVNARHWRAAFEDHAHQAHARKAGITEAQITAIRHGTSPDFSDPIEQLTWELAVALHDGGPMAEPLYERCMAQFGHQGVQDLIGLAGLYTMIAMTLNVYNVLPVQTEPQPPGQQA